MSHSRRPERRRIRSFRGLLLAWSLTWAASPWAMDAEPVWLAVHARPDASAIDQLLLRDAQGGLWAQRGDLESWGLLAPRGEPDRRDGIEWYALDAQDGLRARFDAAEQTLRLDVAPQLRALHLRSLRDERLSPDTDAIEPGGWLDADLQALHDGQDTHLAGLFGLSRFGRAGFARLTGLGDERDFTRLDSTWSIEQPEAMERIDLGDGIVRAGAWGRSLRFGGISMGTDFALQPDLVTFPQPELRGLAELPSTLDIYVNGLLARRTEVDAGPFVLSDMPVQEGANRTRVVVRDALGREQVITQAFYAPAQLLRPGLRDLRLDAGWLRQDYGLSSFDYGSGFVAASLRQGIDETLTLETRAEAGTRRQAAGLAATLGLPFGGVGELALAASQGRPGRGLQLRSGLDWRNAVGLSLGARLRRVTRDWTDLGENRRATRRQQLSANLGLVPAPGWSAALTFVRQSARGEATQDLLVLGLSTRLGRRGFVGASAVRDLSTGEADFVGLSLVGRFGGGTQLLQAQRAGGRDVAATEWQRNTEDAFDASLRLRAQTADGALPARTQLDWGLPGEHGALSAALAHDRDTTALRLGGATRLAWLGGDRFWTRPGADGFAVIDAHGLAGVGVLQDQRLAARTDARGLALVPGLRPWQANRFELVDADVPIEAEVQALDKVVVPAARGGTRVAFAVQAPRGHGLRLELPDGRPVPAGARVTDPLTGLRVALGRDGRAWWPHGELPRDLEVRVRGRSCHGRLPRGHDEEPVLRLHCAEPVS